MPSKNNPHRFTHRLDKSRQVTTFTPVARQAGVAELVDARDSKSRFLGSMGSIPIAGIFQKPLFYKGFLCSGASER